MDNPFESHIVMPWKSVFAWYIDQKRRQVQSWNEFCRDFERSTKTVKAIRDQYGIHESVGPNAQPSPNFRPPGDHFLGEGI